MAEKKESVILTFPLGASTAIKKPPASQREK